MFIKLDQQTTLGMHQFEPDEGERRPKVDIQYFRSEFTIMYSEPHYCYKNVCK